jgi:hypothetical protein
MAVALALAATSLLASARARAADVPAGGGLVAVTARVDVAHGTLDYGTCTGAPPCATPDHEKIRIDGAIDPRKVHTTPVQMDGGRHALWVHVDALDGKGWDAILAGRAHALVYASPTGYQGGQPGSMFGQVVELVPTDGGRAYLARGQVSEDVTLCGRPALLHAEVLDPQSLDWRGASFQRLSQKDRDDATPIIATARAAGAGDKPLAPLLAARATSSSSAARALVDMDPSTVWSEDRGGMGRGEFVVMNAPSDVPIARLAVTIAPPAPSANGAAPKSFYLATHDRIFEVTLPEDAWLHPGATYDVPLPEPIKSSCLALVLDEAYVRGGHAKPDVSVAELWAYSELDGPNASLASVAAELGAGGRKAEVAAGILKRAGDAALAGVVGAWDKLDTYGRSLALDVGEGASCGAPATQLFLRGLCDKDLVVARKAESALQRCGRASRIVDAVKAAPAAMCPKVPTYLALLGQSAALPLLADLVATGSTQSARADARHAFATAARNAPPQMLTAMIGDAQRDPHTRLELLRAIAPRLPEMAAPAIAALDALLGPNADFATRYLALEPLAALAKGGDRGAAARIGAMLAHDPDWPIRARAAEIARDLPAIQSELVSAIDDKEPRVRQAALDAMAELRVSPAAVLVEKHLEPSEPWTFVRVSAARALGAMPAARDLDKSLADALAGDESARVRGAIIAALAAHRARAYSDAITGRLDDGQELVEVRAAAARALGSMCEAKQLDRLTELARSAADPMASGDELELGLAAIDALGDIHPADLAGRLAKLRDRSVRDAVRSAAEHALAAKGVCR